MAMYPNLPDAALQDVMCKLLEYTFKYQSQHGLFSIEIRRGFADNHKKQYFGEIKNDFFFKNEARNLTF